MSQSSEPFPEWKIYNCQTKNNIHKDGGSDAEADDSRPFVYKNVLDCIKRIINASLDFSPELVAPRGHYMSGSKSGQGDNYILTQEGAQAILDHENSTRSDDPFDANIASKIAKLYEQPRAHGFIRHNQAKLYTSPTFASDASGCTQVLNKISKSPN
ncbi:hypothetical protein JCM33374_g5598 [Metschnikowia sp. JCM 33374]|nr:hypothetical protein JCM33374_g5598 [Metschnikowia sp. JCM 33374]